jgi:hypothetical protein
MEERRGRAVIENMAQVSAACGATDLDPLHEKRKIVLIRDVVFVDGGRETRPARAVVVLRFGAEQGSPAAGANIQAVLPEVVMPAAERLFCAALPQDLVLFGGQGFFPLLFRFPDLLGHGARQ